MSSGARMTGVRAMLNTIRKVRKIFPDDVGAALYQESEIEAKEVKKRTPVDKGPLRASVHVVGPERRGATIYCMIVAGGTAAPYAIYVHEDLEAFHKVGQAKYLESVILESRAHMGARVARRVTLNKLNA